MLRQYYILFAKRGSHMFEPKIRISRLSTLEEIYPYILRFDPNFLVALP